MLNISYRVHKTKLYVWQQVDIHVGRQEILPLTVKRRKLSWFGHVCRHNAMPKTILDGPVDGSRRRGRPRKSWKDMKISDYSGMTPC